MSFAERWTSHVRLAILLSLLEAPEEERLRLYVLHVLARVPGRSATVSLMCDLLADMGIEPGRDAAAAHLAWLDRSSLVDARGGDAAHLHESRARHGVGAMILDLGIDVAAGRASVPGVAPAPTLDWLQGNLDAKALRVPRSEVVDHIRWMSAAALVTWEGDAAPLYPTRKGIDVALGRDQVDGVKAPSSATILRMAAAAAASRLGG